MKRMSIIDTESNFRYKKPNGSKLLQYGFTDNGSFYSKNIPIMEKQFLININIDKNGFVGIKVTEFDSGEEYALINVDDAQGKFVGHMRKTCENILSDVALNCFDTEILKSDQTNRILDHIHDIYEVEPEFLWERYPGYAAFRRKDNKKWFALIMTVNKGKLGLSGLGDIEIMDLKAEPHIVGMLQKQEDYYPAYHMNKKHWFTVCLDGSVSDDTLFKLLESSYQCASKK